jgi:hypothetical protein
MELIFPLRAVSEGSFLEFNRNRLLLAIGNTRVEDIPCVAGMLLYSIEPLRSPNEVYDRELLSE